MQEKGVGVQHVTTLLSWRLSGSTSGSVLPDNVSTCILRTCEAAKMPR